MKKVTHSFFCDKRGVSEIVASLIIMLIVTVAGAGLYAYSLNAFSSSGSTFLQQTIGREERAQEQFLIIAVWWNVSNNYMNITILNYGKIELVIDAVYIDGIQVSVSAFTDGKGETVAIKSLVSVKFTSPVLIADGETHEIIVVSKRGSNNVVYWEA